MRVKEECEQAGLKFNIKKTKTMASSPIECFMANRTGKAGSSERFPLLGPKITADVDYSHEIGRHLVLGRKTITNLDCILKAKISSC